MHYVLMLFDVEVSEQKHVPGLWRVRAERSNDVIDARVIETRARGGTLLVYKAVNFEQQCNATEAILPPLTLPFFNLLQNDLSTRRAVTYAAPHIALR